MTNARTRRFAKYLLFFLLMVSSGYHWIAASIVIVLFLAAAMLWTDLNALFNRVIKSC